MKRKFVRRDSVRFSKLGKNRKKIQKWRRPKGRHNKMRLRRTGYPIRPEVGHKKKKSESGRIEGMKSVLVYNLKELTNTDKNSAIIIGKIGTKKKLELIKKASELKLKIINIGGKQNAVK